MKTLGCILIQMAVWSSLSGPAVASGVGGAEAAAAGGRLEVYHLLIGPGRKPISRFGHDALRVRDTRTGRDVLYNWGAMEPGQVRNLSRLFLRRLGASLKVGAWRANVERYREEDRTLVLQTLNLPAGAASRLMRRLNENLRPENSSYRYGISDDNCSTRLRDLLDNVLEGELRRQATGPSRIGTRRDQLFRVVGRTSTTDLMLTLVAFGLNKRIDRPAADRYDALTLPLDVSEFLGEVTLVHPGGRVKPLVSREIVLHESEVGFGPKVHGWLWAGWLVIFLPCLLTLLDRRRARLWAAAGISVWGLLAGVIGVAVATVGVWALPGGVFEGNVAYFSPLHLALLPFAWRLGRGGIEAGALQALGLLLCLGAAVAGLNLAAATVGVTGCEDLEVGVFAMTAGLACLVSWVAVRRSP